jgi:cathepsin L
MRSFIGDRLLASDDLSEYDPADLPTSFDWKDKDGVMSPVKNQGGCGSCWAFATTEAIESAAALADKELKILAPQQLVDCTPNPKQCGGSGGCEGATAEIAMTYLMGSKGLALEKDYRYRGRDEKCRDESVSPAVTIEGYKVVSPNNDPTAMQTALVNIGPLSISVAAEPW